jgi:hypothetical protein
MALSTLVVKLVTEHGDLIKGLDTAAGGVKKFVGDTQKSIKGLSLTDLKSGFELAGMAAEGLGTVYTALVGDTMEYAKQTRDLAENLGISAEETSSLIQVADDAGISVDTLTKSLEMAVKKGFKPSVDNLAKLADEYNAISDPIERAARLNDVFGKGWADLTPLLKEGGNAMRDAAAEAKAMGLTLSEVDVQAARDLEVAVDNLGDKVEALKIKVGKGLIPEMVNMADSALFTISVIEGTVTQEDLLNNAIEQSTKYFGENNQATQLAKKALADYQQEQQRATTATDAGDRAQRRSAEATQAAAEAYNKLKPGLAAYYQAQRDGASTSAISIANEEKLRGAIDLTRDAMGKLTTATLYAKASKDLDAKAALELGLKLGVIDSKSVDALRALQDLRVKADSNRDGFIDAKEAASGYIDEVAGIAEAQKLIERNILITITTKRRYGGAIDDDTGDTTETKSRAMGGPTGAGGLFVLHPNEWVLSEAQRYGRVPIPSGAIPAVPQQGVPSTTINNFYDTLATKMYLEQQRADGLRRISERM